MLNDVQISPLKDDEGLMFHFTEPSEEIREFKNLNSYLFVQSLIKLLTKDYSKEENEKISLIFPNAKTLIYVLAVTVRSYEEYRDEQIFERIMYNFDRSYTKKAKSNQEISDRKKP